MLRFGNIQTSLILLSPCNDILGGYCGGVPPLPIPNREVKPTYADGTAMQCGRVGSRLLLEASKIQFFGAFFVAQSALCALFLEKLEVLETLEALDFLEAIDSIDSIDTIVAL